MCLVAAILIVAGDMVKVAITTAEEAAAKSTGPGALAVRVLDHFVGVGTGCTSVSVLVMLVEGISAPEDAVAIGTRVPLEPLVKLVLMPFPVKLALESDVAECAPECSLGLG